MRPRLATLGLTAALAACSGADAARRAPGPAVGGGTSLPERFGIEVEPPRLAAAGYLVDLRYRVLDPVRAEPLGEGGAGARLLDRASGEALPLAGRPARKPEAGKVYSLFFDNTLRKVAAGARVTLELGGLELRDLTVVE